eukprot:9126707-Karenia_brevis.AAC.1
MYANPSHDDSQATLLNNLQGQTERVHEHKQPQGPPPLMPGGIVAGTEDKSCIRDGTQEGAVLNGSNDHSSPPPLSSLVPACPASSPGPG